MPDAPAPHASASAPPATPGAGAGRRVAALDGLRGFALLGMMAWHAQLDWVKGGFARMTVFFVLAGYLACRSALRLGAASEAGPRGRGGVVGAGVAFWGRRARRLLPVTALGVVVSVVATRVVGTTSRGDVVWDSVATLTSWQNWRLVATSQDYGALFESPSAFQHYWSLSLEEQCFILVPAIVALAQRVAGRPLARAGALFGAGALLGALPLVWVQDVNTVYYGTHVRLGEFLVGMALGVVAAEWGARPPAAVDRVLRWAGPLSLATLLVVMLTVPRDLAGVYRGGLWLTSLPAVAVVAAAVVGEPVTSRVLAVAPLRWVGRAAFSIYVLHWPVFLVLDDVMRDQPRPLVVVTEIAVSLALGAAVHRAYERPLMEGRPVLRGPGMAWTGALAVVALVAATTAPAGRQAIDFEDAADRAAELDAAVGATDPDLAGGEIPTLVTVFGSSSGLILGLGLNEWVQDHEDGGVHLGPGSTVIGCGMLTDGLRDAIPFGVQERPLFEPALPECLDWREQWADQMRRAAELSWGRPMTAVVVLSTWDLQDRRASESAPVVAVGDPDVDDPLRSAIDDATTLLLDAGAGRIVFVTPVAASPAWSGADRARHDERAEVLDGILDDAVAGQRDAGHEVDVVDLHAWSAAQDDDEAERLFPDGIHTTDETAYEVWDRFLLPELRRLGAVV